MDIVSSDGQSRVQITYGGFDDPRNYSVMVSSHGFSGANEGVFFLKKDQFMMQLIELIGSRCKSAVLEGSENFKLEISPFGSTGSLWVDITIGKVIYFHPGPKSRDFISTCGFVVSAEASYSVVKDFEILFNPKAG